MSAQMLFLHRSTPEGRELSLSNIFYPDTIWSSACWFCIAFLCNSYYVGLYFYATFKELSVEFPTNPFLISQIVVYKNIPMLDVLK